MIYKNIVLSLLINRDFHASFKKTNPQTPSNTTQT